MKFMEAPSSPSSATSVNNTPPRHTPADKLQSKDGPPKLVIEPPSSPSSLSWLVTKNMTRGYRLVTKSRVKKTTVNTVWRDLELRSRLYDRN